MKDSHRAAAMMAAACVVPVLLPAAPSHADTTAAPSAPLPQQSAATREDRAIDWADDRLGSDAYNFRCGQFVANAYGKPNLGFNSALEFHDHLAAIGQIHSDTDFPKGALVFSISDFDVDNGVHQGHVMIARGDGTFISGGMSQDSGTGHTVQVANSWNPDRTAGYLGWASAPADWPGP